VLEWAYIYDLHIDWLYNFSSDGERNASLAGKSPNKPVGGKVKASNGEGPGLPPANTTPPGMCLQQYYRWTAELQEVIMEGNEPERHHT